MDRETNRLTVYTLFGRRFVTLNQPSSSWWDPESSSRFIFVYLQNRMRQGVNFLKQNLLPMHVARSITDWTSFCLARQQCAYRKLVRTRSAIPICPSASVMRHSACLKQISLQRNIGCSRCAFAAFLCSSVSWSWHSLKQLPAGNSMFTLLTST